jgi:hypothetical protein
MAPSVCLYTILFTLEHIPCHKNKYIDVFIIWLSFLIKSKSLNENDKAVVLMDKYTFQYLNSLPAFINIIKQNKYEKNVFYIILKQPKTVMEGCMWKYTTFNERVLNQFSADIYFYMDTDILINKSLKIITDQMKPNSIYIDERDNSHYKNNEYYYFDGIPQNEMELFMTSNIKGVSAGNFAFYGKYIMLEIFNRIIEYNKVETKFETLEQPLFNRALFNYYIIDKKINVLHNMNSLITSYSVPINFDSTLIDCCGDPGNDLEHYEKIVNILVMKYLSL